MKRKSTLVVATLGAAALTLAACGSGSGDGGDMTITFVYRQLENDAQEQGFQSVKEQFETDNPGVILELMPIQGQEDDFKARVELMQSSDDTAPDIVYQDGSRINSAAAANFLAPLDDYVAGWDDWEFYPDSSRAGGQSVDGTQYMVPLTTDNRAIWYSRHVFEAAGLSPDFVPETWDDILDAARAIRDNVPDAVPLIVNMSTAAQEATTMQGFQMLLSGTPDSIDDGLYNPSEQKWVVDSQGFLDSLEFYQTMLEEDLGPNQADWLDSSLGNTAFNTWFPNDQLGMVVNGSWNYAAWLETGTTPWPEWTDAIGLAPMPTQHGQSPGATSMSGSNGLMISERSQNKDLAFEAITYLAGAEHTRDHAVVVGVLPPRLDVAEDPDYLASNPTAEFFTGLTEVTNYRPELEEYPQISVAIQTATESVATGAATPEEALATYGDTVRRIVGDDAVTSRR